MIVEPFAHDRLEQNLNPISRISYAASIMTCVPGALAQTAALLSAPRRAKAGCERSSSAKAGFRAFAELPRRHSTSCSRQGPDRVPA